MLKLKVWGGVNEINAAAHLFQIDIAVYEYGQEPKLFFHWRDRSLSRGLIRLGKLVGTHYVCLMTPKQASVFTGKKIFN